MLKQTTQFFALLSIAWFWVSSSLALPSAPPAHSITPELHNLNVAYLVKKTSVNITIYVINHEAFEVQCDAQYNSGPDKQEAPDKLIPPNGKADVFKFSYGRRSESVHLRLLCVNSQDETNEKTLDNN